MSRVYLDWNATAPLRPEARAAMLDASDIVGNPSSIHAEGRAAKAALERAREQIASALGAEGADVIFTSGATEAAALALQERGLACSGVEHPAVLAWCATALPTDAQGQVAVPEPAAATLQLANSETGVLQDLPQGLAVSDLTQAFGKIPFSFNWLGVDAGFVSAHKLGGPRGVGALILRRGTEIEARLKGGGQEQGRRAGTENLIGIMGFAAAAQAAQNDLDQEIWEKVSEIRDSLMRTLESGTEMVTFPGRESRRLPNTLCILTPGWRGETQVMQMDLAGFAISAGSACSSGKVRPSSVLTAMGIAAERAGDAIRVSIGPTTDPRDVARFADAWLAAHHRWRQRNDQRATAGRV
ncbi:MULTISPECIES: cysteine desulfurase family protein [unclassified Paracoccus (in: a-proteobacteria)]|uniref:cysteine desulfurase family protein n=1 Tax=unclassified Paracoccus (in: a-proteobacteria) TaxID=2688777 RepID=UPI0012B1C4B6|nr:MULTISPECIES: cysteine desulfurase family protein [unclassified Paracoccus (in: a-proteobacteria)]UXU74086.1 cysteine desulfurase [Paracoccus sp. SMMA_5]UXU79976.1 cysteine desulfurase [Paracoccus sp. SMMA_5_TC]